MTHADYLALLAAVCAAPDDDAPRLVLADWLDIDGPPACRDVERAEFIRVQVRIGDLYRELMSDEDCGDPNCPGCQELRTLLARERELHPGDRLYYGRGDYDYFTVTPADFRGGFPFAVTCDAASWLKAGDALSWSPEQTDECKACGGWGNVANGWKDEEAGIISETVCIYCKAGRVPRPCPPTAMPVTEVRLTTELAVQRDGRSRWSFIGDPHGWRSEPFDPTWTLGGEYAAIAAEVILQVCRLRWPAVKTWHLPPEPWVNEHPRDDRGRWTADDEARALNGDPDAPVPLGVIDVEEHRASSAAPDARRRAGHSRMPAWLSEQRGQRPPRR